MAKSSATLDWCIVRLGADHNWWVDEVSDPVRWDVDGLSVIDPRQMSHLLELVEPLRDYGFHQTTLEAAFIPFRIEREAPGKRVRLKRVKDSFFETEEKLFGLPDILDEENGPYADLLDQLTRCRVKMLNDLFAFESKLTVDEIEDEIRENQNTSFAEGKALHAFDEIIAILDFMPSGYETEEGEEAPRKAEADLDNEDLPELDEADEERLKNDQSLNWDEAPEEKEEKPEAAPAKSDLDANDIDMSVDDDEEEAEEEEEEEGEEADELEEKDDDAPATRKKPAIGGDQGGKKKTPPPKSRGRR